MNFTKGIIIILLVILLGAVLYYTSLKPITTIAPVNEVKTVVKDTAIALVTSQVIRVSKDTLSVEKAKQYEEWLNELHLAKPIKSYMGILSQLYKSMAGSPNIDLKFLLDKEAFQSLIAAFQILPFEDKYIIAGNKYDHDRFLNDWAIIAKFNKNDSLLVFKYELEEEHGSRGSDSLYLEDWNKDGHVEFFRALPFYQANSRLNSDALDVCVYDVTSIDNEILTIFEYNSYTHENYERGGKDHIDTDISFEPTGVLKKLVTRPNGTKKPDLIEIQYYKQDKITKEYIEVPK
jgi:hypothetical protein